MRMCAVLDAFTGEFISKQLYPVLRFLFLFLLLFLFFSLIDVYRLSKQDSISYFATIAEPK